MAGIWRNRVFHWFYKVSAGEEEMTKDKEEAGRTKEDLLSSLKKKTFFLKEERMSSFVLPVSSLSLVISSSPAETL